MDDTATAAAEDELTEFEMIEVESIKAVPMGANGFGHLIMKGIPGTAALITSTSSSVVSIGARVRSPTIAWAIWRA